MGQEKQKHILKKTMISHYLTAKDIAYYEYFVDLRKYRNKLIIIWKS